MLIYRKNINKESRGLKKSEIIFDALRIIEGCFSSIFQFDNVNIIL